MQTRNAIVFVDIPAGSAKAGMFARGTFEIGKKEIVTLPAGAVVMKDGFAYVMQVGADGRVKQVKIQTGGRESGNVEIIGLDTAMENNFVSAGGAFLADGDLVSIAGQTTTAITPISKAE
jgi:multidrug efflux pump subunit AcrA (membrane-fusion protein)